MEDFNIGAMKARNILAQFGVIEKAEMSDEEVMKARQVGDMHPNGKWVWTEYKPGRFDWRPLKGRGGVDRTPQGGSDDKTKPETKQETGGEKHSSSDKKEGGKEKKTPTLDDYAKKTPTKTLENAAKSSKAPESVKAAAEAEIKRRSDSKQKKDVDVSDLPDFLLQKVMVDPRAPESVKIVASKELKKRNEGVDKKISGSDFYLLDNKDNGNLEEKFSKISSDVFNFDEEKLEKIKDTLQKQRDIHLGRSMRGETSKLNDLKYRAIGFAKSFIEGVIRAKKEELRGEEPNAYLLDTIKENRKKALMNFVLADDYYNSDRTVTLEERKKQKSDADKILKKILKKEGDEKLYSRITRFFDLGSTDNIPNQSLEEFKDFVLLKKYYDIKTLNYIQDDRKKEMMDDGWQAIDWVQNVDPWGDKHVVFIKKK